MIKIGIQPNYPQFEGDRLFALGHEYSDYWQKPFVELQARGKERGYQIHTLDQWDKGECDLALLMDLPRSRKELLALLQEHHSLPWILQLVESALGQPYWFNKQNHAEFEAIASYNASLCDGDRYFYCPFPVAVDRRQIVGASFEERKLLLILNNVSRVGVWANRGHGLRGLPFFGPLFSGYKVGIRDLLLQHKGELLSHRIRVGRIAESMGEGLVHMYGSGWNGESIGWVNKFRRDQPFAGFKGRRVRQFDVLPNYRFFLAFENQRSNSGFITQKLFDAMHAGIVPVYLGESRITEHVWPECFVDARAFNDYRDMLKFLLSMSRTQWEVMRKAGAEYLASEAIWNFSEVNYANRILHVIERVMGRGGAKSKK